MRQVVTVARGRKRRPITRRDWRRDGRRGARRRVWVGSRPGASVARPLFFPQGARQVARVSPADLFGAAAMLAGVASWSVLAALLGS